MFDRRLGRRMIDNLAREGCLRLLRATVPSRAGANRPFCVAKRAGAGVGTRLPRAMAPARWCMERCGRAGRGFEACPDGRGDGRLL